MSPSPPGRLPANFDFSAGGKPPDRLPADFDFNNQAKPVDKNDGWGPKLSVGEALGEVLLMPVKGLLNAPAEVIEWFKRGGRNAGPSGGFLTEEPMTMALGNAMAAAGAEPGATTAAVKSAASDAVQAVKSKVGPRYNGGPSVMDKLRSPAVQDVVGIVSPRASHMLSTAKRAARVVDRVRGTADDARAGSVGAAVEDAALDPRFLDPYARKVEGRVVEPEPARPVVGPRQPVGPVEPPAELAPGDYYATRPPSPKVREIATLDEISKSLTGKQYMRLNPAEQHKVRAAAERINNGIAAAPPEAPPLPREEVIPQPSAVPAAVEPRPVSPVLLDDAGQPVVAYKGMPVKDWRTGQEITEIRSTNGPWAGFFTSEKPVAERFAKAFNPKGNPEFPSHVVEANLQMERPYVVDAQGQPARNFQFDNITASSRNAELRKAIQDPRYDGVIIKNTSDEGTLYVPKDPSQVRRIDRPVPVSGGAAAAPAPEIVDSPRYVFHGTSSTALESIQREGQIRPSRAGKTIHYSDDHPDIQSGVYVTDSPVAAMTFAQDAAARSGGEAVILQIPGERLSSLRADPEMSRGFIHGEPIPASYLESVYRVNSPSDVKALMDLRDVAAQRIPRPAAAPAPEVPVPGPQAPATLAEVLREEMLRSGTITPEQAVPRPAAPAPAPKPDLAPMMRDLSPEVRKETAKANYRAQQEGAPAADAAEVYKAAHRQNRAEALGKALYDGWKSGKIEAADVNRFGPGEWDLLSDGVGLKSKPSLATIKEAKEVFKRLQESEPAAPEVASPSPAKVEAPPVESPKGKGARAKTQAFEEDAEGKLIPPKIPDTPRPLVKQYGPNWESRPDAAELKAAYNKAVAARSRGLKAYKAYVEESNRRWRGKSTASAQ